MRKRFTQPLILVLICTTVLSIAITGYQQAQAQTSNNIEITNLSGTNTMLTSDQLSAIPKTQISTPLLCYGRPLSDGVWGGVLLSSLLNLTGITPDVASLRFTAGDGYRVDLPIELAMQPNIIIAYELNDEPLQEGLRLVLPGYNGAAWIAMIKSISLSQSAVATPALNYPDYSLPMEHSISKPSTLQPATPQPSQTPKATPKTTPHTQTPAPSNQPDIEPTSTPPPVSTEAVGTHATLLYGIAAIAITVLPLLGGLMVRQRKRQALKR